VKRRLPFGGKHCDRRNDNPVSNAHKRADQTREGPGQMGSIKHRESSTRSLEVDRVCAALVAGNRVSPWPIEAGRLNLNKAMPGT
jgi:hypothetical protein